MAELRFIGGGRAGLSTYELYVESLPPNQLPLTLSQWLQQQGATGEALQQALQAAAAADGSADVASAQAGVSAAQAGIATTQAGIATTQAGIATTQANAAAGSAGTASGHVATALGHRNAAEAAAASAAVAAGEAVGVYATTAGGLAATVQGAQFRIVDGVDLIQYRHDAGPVATEVARFPSFEGLVRAVDVLSSEEVAEFHGGAVAPDFAILNGANEVLFSLPARDGADWLAAFHPGPSGIDFAMTDAAGKVVFGWQDDGTFIVGGGNSELSGTVATLQGDVDTLQTGLSAVGDQVQALGEAQQFGFGVFATVAAGLAATVDGDYFAVSAPGSDVFQTLYLNNGGAEQFVNRVPQPELAPVTDGLVAPGQLYRDNGIASVRRTYGNLWSPTGTPNSFATFALNIFDGHQDLHALYDAFLAAHPDYLSVQTIGTDALGNQIREYTAAAPAFRLGTGDFAGWSAGDVAHPKIVLIGGTHGSERTAFLSLLHLMDDLCNNWHLDRRIAELRWGAELVFIPTICPSGCDAKTRKNHNGVNINRNHNWNWATTGSTDPDHTDYKGPFPESELETQIGAALPGRHPTAAAFIDFHNHTGPGSTGFSSWTGVSRLSELGVALEQLLESQIHMSRDFPAFDPDGLQWSRITTNAGGTVTGAIINNFNRPAYLHETPRWWTGQTTLDLLRHNHRSTLSSVHNIWRREMLRRLLAI
jgi:hypothetical protein